VAEELSRRDDPRSAELARRLLTAAGEEAEMSIQDVNDAAGDAMAGIRRVEELLAELRTLSGGCPTSPAERVDVALLLGAWAQEALLRRPVRVETASPVWARVGCDDLESSLERILAFLSEAAPMRQREPPEPVVIRAGYEAGCPVVQLEDRLLELSEARRAELFDPHIQADSRDGRTMRLNLHLALAWWLLRRMDADLTVSSGDSGGSVFRLVLPVAD
jgi:K+-sensing histidine kinase KdpD